MTDFSHLDALELRLSHERSYLAQAKRESERELRRVWISQIEREIAGERAFLGLSDDNLSEMSAEDLLAELMA